MRPNMTRQITADILTTFSITVYNIANITAIIIWHIVRELIKCKNINGLQMHK